VKAVVLATAVVGLAAATAAAADAPGAAPQTIELPSAEGGIGFDDLRYAPSLRRLLVPAGRTGRLDLVDADGGGVESVGGFAAQPRWGGGHGEGTTSADAGAGIVFAIDRSARQLVVVDPAAKAIVARVGLGAEPDYVRFVAPTREVWVTQPGAEQIEVFRLSRGAAAVPETAATIYVPGGPESLVIDELRSRAYTHLWKGATLAIDLRTRAPAERWGNPCRGSRGIALDAARGLLFVACAEGRAAVLDVEHGGRELARATLDSGVDALDYDSERRHLYVPSAVGGTLAIFGVSARGELEELGSLPAAAGAHGVASDGAGTVAVGDPRNGRLLLLRDPFPAAP
jgi:hypothetical protein